MSRPTFLKCRDYPSSRDQLFQTVEIETLDKYQEISIFRVVETVETWFLNCRERP